MFVAPLGVWFWLHERRENFIVLDRITILRFHLAADKSKIVSKSGTIQAFI